MKTGVLILSPTIFPDVGGVETHLFDLIKEVRKERDLEAYAFSYKPIVTEVDDYLPREAEGNVIIRRYWWFGHNLFHKLRNHPVLLLLYMAPYLGFRVFLFLLTHASRIKVIHVHGIMMAAVGLLLGRLFGKRVVMQTHALYGFQTGSLYARFCGSLIAKMDAVLALCGESKRELERIGVPSGIIQEYRYWVDLEIFKPRNRAQSRQELGWKDAFTVLFVGRLIRIKGADVVCQLAARMPHIRFVIVGDGPDKESVVEAAFRLDNLVYSGRALNARLPVYYSAADVTIVPSQYAEGYGRVIPESLACGTPVVATNAGGIPDAMDGTVGVLCGMEVAGYQEALVRLSENRDLYECMRRNARPYALAHNGPQNASVIFSQYRMRSGE